MQVRREPVSIICVFNDPDVRRHCLDRSIEQLRAGALDVDYVPVDNVDAAFSSAGAALNHGVTLARNDYFVFVHQDVYLHSIRALEQAAGRLADDESLGLIGAIGITTDGRLMGQIRDRVVLLGESAPEPVDVDSVDEVLFMTSRTNLKAEPLTELPELAWHAYGVEYGLRMRSLGKRVVATNLAVTHNSLTINLARLDTAHTRVGAAYPQALPVRTTCGTITSATTGSSRPALLRNHRWRYPWLKESVLAHRGRWAARGGPFVLSDIRRDIDDAIAGRAEPLAVVNLLDASDSFPDNNAGLSLLRRGQPIEPVTLPRPELAGLLAGWQPGTSMLVTNLRQPDFAAVAATVAPEARVAGYHEGIGYWLLLGPVLNTPARQWYSVRSTPAGMHRLAS